MEAFSNRRDGANEAAVEVWRGPLIESRHRVHVAVVDAAGRMRAEAGDPLLVTFARSVVKPIQTLPLVEDGVIERFGLTPAELALCCGSHNGERVHVRTAREILRKIGADEDALACGPHSPMHEDTARALERRGARPGRLHNNCSGKHAGMLALARVNGWPLAGYERAEHPLQRRMLETVARWARIDPEEVPLGVDGCGVCTFAMRLTEMAGAFARLAEAARRGGGEASRPEDGADDRSAPARVVGAMVANPHLVAGTDRLSTDLMRVSRGRIFAKIGAEGVYCAGVPGAELGIALKIDDGAKRAVEPALIAVLRTLGLLSDEEVAELTRYAEPTLTNTCGEAVGQIRVRMTLEPGRG